MPPTDRRRIHFQILLFLVSVLQITAICCEDIDHYAVESVQVLFRHGDRTPRKYELYPKLPYNASIYGPIGLGQLNEMGRHRAYRLGMLLRKEYDTFLGDYPHPGNVFALSTDVDRAKGTLDLVLAGLYSVPNAQSDEADWIPVPTFYVPLIVDMLLMPQPCSKYIEEFKKVRNSPEINLKVESYRDVYKIVAENTGLDMSTIPIVRVFNTYQLLESQTSMNIRKPQWVTPRVQRRMEDVVEFAYDLMSWSTAMKRLIGGPMIRQFIENMNLDGKREKPQKIFLYSAHDLNVANFARASGFKDPEIPYYCSMIVFEKLRGRSGAKFVRIRLWTGVTEKWITYSIPGCGKICPAHKYVNLMRRRNVIPTDDEMNCLWNSVTKDDLEEYYSEFKGKVEPYPPANKHLF